MVCRAAVAACVLAAAIGAAAEAQGPCLVEVLAQECGDVLDRCAGVVRRVNGGALLPCSTTIYDATEAARVLLHEEAQGSLLKPHGVKLGACATRADTRGKLPNSAVGTRLNCSPLLSIDMGLIQTAGDIASAPSGDDGLMGHLMSAVNLVLDGLVERSALKVATLGSTLQALQQHVHSKRPLVFQYTLAPDLSRRHHEPSKFALPLLNDTAHGGEGAWLAAHEDTYLQSIVAAGGAKTGPVHAGTWADLPSRPSHAMPYSGIRLGLPMGEAGGPVVRGGLAPITPVTARHLEEFVTGSLGAGIALSHTVRVLLPDLTNLPTTPGQFSVFESVLCTAPSQTEPCAVDSHMVRAGLDLQRAAAADAPVGSRDVLMGAGFRFDTCNAVAAMPLQVPWMNMAPGTVATISVAFHTDATVDVQVNGMSAAVYVPHTKAWARSPAMATPPGYSQPFCHLSVYQRALYLGSPDSAPVCDLDHIQSHVKGWARATHWGYYSFMNMPPSYTQHASTPELALRQFKPADRLQALRTTTSSLATWYGRIQTPVPADMVLRAPEGHGFGAVTIGRVAVMSVHYMDHTSGAFASLATFWEDIQGGDIPGRSDMFPYAGGAVVLNPEDGYILTTRTAALGGQDVQGAEPPACRQFLIKCSSAPAAIPNDAPQPCFVARLVKLSSPELDLALLKVERGLGMGTARSPGTINPATITPSTYGARGVKFLTDGMRKCLRRTMHKAVDAPAAVMGFNGATPDARFASGIVVAKRVLGKAQDAETLPVQGSAPPVLAGSPVFFELEGTSPAVHKCAHSTDTHPDRESALLLGVASAPGNLHAASASNMVPVQAVQRFLDACSAGTHVPAELDPESRRMGLPECVRLEVNSRTGMVKQAHARGLPAYAD